MTRVHRRAPPGGGIHPANKRAANVKQNNNKETKACVWEQKLPIAERSKSMCLGTEAPDGGKKQKHVFGNRSSRERKLALLEKGRRRNNGHCSCMAECSLSDCPVTSLPANCDHLRSLNNASAWFSHIRQLVGMCFRPSEKAADAPLQLPSCMWTAPKFPHALGKKPSIMESRIIEQLVWDRIMGQHVRTPRKIMEQHPPKIRTSRSGGDF